MLFPDEAGVTQQCFCFPSICANNVSTGIHSALQNVARRNSFGRRFHHAHAGISRLWRGSEQTAYI
jgi:hypothetical protein